VIPILALHTQTAQAARIRMLRQAMKDRAPQMYRDLDRTEMLEAVLSDLEQEMIDSFDEAKMEITLNAKAPGLSLEWEQEVTMKLNEAWHQTIETWTEFPEEQTT
jgi:hypothetical protein